jgi:hypothetical protein
MKKPLAVPLLLSLSAVAFAFDLSAGIGGTVGTFSSTFYYENLGIFDSFKERSCTVPVAFTAFIDATFGMAAIGFCANGNTRQNVTTVISGSTTDWAPSDDECRSGFLSMSLLGKYPFALGPVSLFPLLGIEYDLILYRKDVGGNDLSIDNLDQFWFKAGAGADITLYRGLYIRPLVLSGFKLLNADEKKRVQDTIDAGASSSRCTDFVFEGGVQVGWRF